jgi:hypothetical protein
MRGWAMALMPAAMDHGVPAAAAADESAHPCHTQAAVTDATPAGTCAMCDLCHSAAAQAPDAPVLAAEPHEALPLATAAVPIEPASPDGLYRPPRSTRA